MGLQLSHGVTMSRGDGGDALGNLMIAFIAMIVLLAIVGGLYVVARRNTQKLDDTCQAKGGILLYLDDQLPACFRKDAVIDLHPEKRK
jgi:hypothetical protein